MAEEETTQYFSKDFKWEDLREEIERDPSLRHHLLSFDPFSTLSPPSSKNYSEAWRGFHHRHSTGRFFKERRYLLKEFPELLHCCDGGGDGEFFKVLEVGCGNGSTVLPILRGNQSIIVYACDCSTEALERANKMIEATVEVSIKQRFHPFFCDLSRSGFPNWLICSKENTEIYSKDTPQSQSCVGGVDFVTLIFTLSAVPFQSMPTAIAECKSALKPGGLLLFRDYGLYDMTMLRFQPDKRMGFREYMRFDGTRSYFFCLETMRELFIGVGFIELELEYCCVKSVNRRNGKKMRRVWVHGKFQKPI
ncbi:hypothetical protein GIB67_036581 [Kingdonia uniflora]|uniref:tRNA N(3)-methylcytidine methyltransferase n=1 Tax=Kingdonia uniflora TaxID=39325 RepID=A0A7J7MEB3_9MAGN|nr:hypothetical protein GIB67_036581 [Kingdonia uniflora]